MLPLFMSMLCASCGSSGLPSDQEVTAELQNSSSATTTIAASDSIIGPGFSGFTIAQAQQEVPTIAAAQSIADTTYAEVGEIASFEGPSVGEAAPAVELTPLSVEPAPVEANPVEVAQVQPVEPIVEEIAPVAVAQVEPVVEETAPLAAVPVEAEVQEPAPLLVAQLEPEVVAPDVEDSDALGSEDNDALSAEAEIELAALEAELAALSEPIVAGAAEPETGNVDSGSIVAGDTVSYESIKNNGLGNGTYPTDDYYLAEFLYQNPNICFWDQNTENKTITALAIPVPPENSVSMPKPTGGDDTSMLEDFISKNAGKSLVGQGTYKVKTLDIKKSVDIYNMPMVPASGAKQMVRVTAPDVRIFNSPIDGQNSATLAVGFNVEDGSDRFVLVKSGFKDIHHKNNADASAVFIRGVNDFYIVCNRFENIINNTGNKTLTARASSIWLNGRNKHNLSGGLIANNYASNHQSNGARKDAEFLALQSYKSVSESNPIRVFANRGYNAGKRLTKFQEGNGLILSNYLEWNTKSGPLGKRTLLSGFAVHFSDNVYVRNNRVKVSADGHFDAIFHTHSYKASRAQDNIHFDNNDIELLDHRDPNANSGPVLLLAMAYSKPLKSEGFEATNSSANNNKIHGPGSLKNYYVFRNGYADTGGRFEHSNNDFSVSFYHSEYLRF